MEEDTIQEELVYAAVSSNRNENNISCRDNLLLYSRCRSPIIYDLEAKIVLAFLHGHSEEVNGQCFVSDVSGEGGQQRQLVHVVSTAHDRRAIIWEIDTAGSNSYKILHEIISPDDSIFTTRCSLMRNGQFVTILTTMSGNIHVYHDANLTQSISTKHCYFDSKYHLAACVRQENTSYYTLVALAGSDNQLHIYSLDSNLELAHVQDLSGFNDWIKCLDFLALPDRPNQFLLATACQDSLIQVWLLKLTSLEVDTRTQVRTKVSTLDESGVKLTSTLETVLSGHDRFVHSLCWFKRSCTKESNVLQLASCSSDKTVVIWKSFIAGNHSNESSISKKYEQSPASEGVWRESVRLGETGEFNLPFLGICLGDDEKTLYAQSLRGAIHSWSLSDDCAQDRVWVPQDAIGGHYDSITDLAWEKTGAYLLSSSADKTCRLHAPSRISDRWHELARPQVHGYEINCLASLNFFRFASGAEEKTIRIFEITQFFIKNFKALAKTALSGHHESELEDLFGELPTHAQLPALGLSNKGSQYPFDVKDDGSGDAESKKPVFSDNNSWQEVGDLVKQLAKMDHLTSLPHEEILLQSTLWWENNKLFGHCNELHALACTSDGSFLASASKANRADLASIIVWETEKFRKVSIIEHHSLTITRLRFSPNDKYLLSVSRDRTWCLSERDPGGHLRNAYRKLLGTVKSNAVHERIIWDCSWTYDSRYFLTVSRDKKAILWSLGDLRSQLDQFAALNQTTDSDGQQQSQPSAMNLNYVSMKQFNVSIQAVDSARSSSQTDSSYLFVLGFEDGSIELHSVGVNRRDKQADQWQLMKAIPNLHQLSVRRLAFQPMQRHDDENDETNTTRTIPLLASGGDDSVVRLTRFHIRA